jgi:hypothetical protein
MPSTVEDIANPAKTDDHGVVAGLASTLGNQEIPLPVRFRALFTLKSLNSAESVDAIANGTLSLF